MGGAGIAPARVYATGGAVNQGPGMDLGTDLEGVFGAITAPLQSLVEGVLADTGLTQAAQLAQSLLADLEQGKVPVISDLEDPFNGDIEAALASALSQTELAAQMVGAVAEP